MKQFDGNIWTDTDSRGVVQIGFTKAYIENQLGECFHVMQADRSTARRGQPIMVLETNDGTSRIKSPVSGHIIKFNGKAMDFPDRLSEEDVIMEVLPEGVKLPEKKKVEYKDVFETIRAGGFQQRIDDVFAEEVAPAVEAQQLGVNQAMQNLQQRAVERERERIQREAAIRQRAAVAAPRRRVR